MANTSLRAYNRRTDDPGIETTFQVVSILKSLLVSPDLTSAKKSTFFTFLIAPRLNCFHFYNCRRFCYVAPLDRGDILCQ